MALRQELEHLGRVLLRIAQERVEREGVHTQTEVLWSDVWQTIAEYLRQVDAAALVIGMPGEEKGKAARSALQSFAERIRNELNIEVFAV